MLIGRTDRSVQTLRSDQELLSCLAWLAHDSLPGRPSWLCCFVFEFVSHLPLLRERDTRNLLIENDHIGVEERVAK